MAALFKEQGKYSLAWWIKLVKDNGEHGALSYLRIKSGLQGDEYGHAKEVIDHLAMSGYIQLKLTRPPSGHGANMRSYVVTSFGHRYLNEHQDELAEAEQTAASNKAETKPKPYEVHKVPDQAPQPKKIPQSAPLNPRPATPSPAPELQVEKPAAQETPPPKTPAVPLAPSPATPDTADFRKQLEALAGSVALTKFGDQITARELIDALKLRESEDA